MNKNSMFYWWPEAKDCGVPMPKTIMVRHEGSFKGELSYSPIDGKPDEYFTEMLENVKKAAIEIEYPIFIRSDGTSNKHDWKQSCYVEREDQLYGNICNILEFSAMMMFGPSFYGIAVREFLELNWKFKAFYGEMPVAKEFRFFVKDGEVQCWHPYWPPRSIQRPSIENWQDILKEINQMYETDYYILEAYSKKIGRKIEGYWSIDFCETKNDGWYMTDMALGEESYHWGTCPNAPPEMLEHYGNPEEIEEPVDWDKKIAELTNNSGEKKQ